jgi:hypothetical protein
LSLISTLLGFIDTVIIKKDEKIIYRCYALDMINQGKICSPVYLSIILIAFVGQV